MNSFVISFTPEFVTLQQHTEHETGTTRVETYEFMGC
jgi:hypothetical protein